MTVFAGDKGNGGDGIEIDGKLYVLDLVEAGVETKPYFSALISGPLTEERLKELFADETYPRTLISHKLAEISSFAPLFADAILQTMEAYQWRLVNGALVNIRDENTVLQYDNLKQLAVRKNGSIFINKSLWNQLDAGNKTALIFHEVLYAMIKPKTINGKTEQVSDRAREVTGYLFTELLSKNDLRGLKKVLRNDYFALAADEMANSLSVMGGGGDYTAYQPKVRVDAGGKQFAFGISNYIPKPEAFQVKEVCEAALAGKWSKTIRILDVYSQMSTELKEFVSEDSTRNYVEVITKEVDITSPSTVSVTSAITVEPVSDVNGCVTQIQGLINAKIDEVKSKYENYEDEVMEDEEQE